MTIHIGPRTISAVGGSIKRVGNYRIHTFPSELVTDGLVLNLDAGDPRSYPGSGTSWTDLSGNGNTATGVGTAMPSYNNGNGGSLVFDGINDYIDCGNGSLLNFGRNNFNISCWIRTSATNAEYSSVVSKYNNASATGPWIQLSNNSSKTVIFGIDGSNFLASSTSVNNNTWRHISCQRTGLTNLEIYVDGVLVASKNDTLNVDCTRTENLLLGAMNIGTPQRWFAGNISVVQIYNRALSAAEVAQNYDALRVRYTGYTNTFIPLCAGGSGRVEVLCVAGGGGGAVGGGGAGGLLYNSAFTINSNVAIGLTVGAGGTGASSWGQNGLSGGNSVFSSLNSIGGGYGAHGGESVLGGSGGGGGYSATGNASGTSGQGNAGGRGGSGAPNYPGGGGGGAGSIGSNGSGTSTAGAGGSGLSYSISGVSQFYAGGGGGATQGGGTGGLGGSGVGGNGASGNVIGINGIPNTGSGGGGSGQNFIGGNGSNGIVIVRYPATDYNVELLIVGGGGGGGNDVGGGGGAGGLIYYSSYPVSAGTKYTVTVGAGGTGGTSTFTILGTSPTNGGNSVFGSLVSFGGGAGGSRRDGAITGNLASSGGSGGGGGYSSQLGASGVSGQGNSGGTAGSSGGPGGGGGGAGGVGAAGTTSGSAAGGVGLTYSITGTSITYAVGGNGGPQAATQSGSTTAGSGGSGGGNNPLQSSAPSGVAGTVIIAYQGPQRGIGGTVDTTSRPGFTLHRFTTTGTDFFIP